MRQLSRIYDGKRATYEGALQELRTNEANESLVRDALGHDTGHNDPALNIDDEYAKVVVNLRSKAPSHLVQILSLTAGTRVGDSKGIALRSIAESAGTGTSLRRMRLKLKGRYESLEQLLTYLDEIKRTPSVISNVEIVKDQFDADILILGI